MRVAILTVSDSVIKGTRTDTSGQAIADWCASRDYIVAKRATVTDETSEISPTIAAWCDSNEVDLVLTTGGTGLSPRDVTPEATRAVIERDANGIAEYIRAQSFNRFPRAALSRGLSGVRGSTLVVNLPGSTGGVTDALVALEPIIDHAIDVLGGRNSHS
ncbi:MAG TPA: MogA/MoaB family molybdenum cofactor biosynthesis protein [Gemmatimonadaceae bacterium]|jgi:molybdenum cofactor synthesis domain-containing protein|nr:MogA/MoaB family molybdenum cofactor biosynthesis protein [Gemmatimonadaceae bacterium]